MLSVVALFQELCSQDSVWSCKLLHILCNCRCSIVECPVDLLPCQAGCLFWRYCQHPLTSACLQFFKLNLLCSHWGGCLLANSNRSVSAALKANAIFNVIQSADSSESAALGAGCSFHCRFPFRLSCYCHLRHMYLRHSDEQCNTQFDILTRILENFLPFRGGKKVGRKSGPEKWVRLCSRFSPYGVGRKSAT